MFGGRRIMNCKMTAVGLEPTTIELKARCSTTELRSQPIVKHLSL